MKQRQIFYRPEETILSIAKTTQANARNNLEALAEFGVSEDMLNQFDTAIQNAEALPDETYNRVELRDLTHDKDDALDACLQWGRKLRTRLELAFGRNAVQVKAFPTEDFRKAVSSEMVDRLVQQSLLLREKDSKDKRVTLFKLSKKAETILEQRKNIMEDCYRKVLEPLGSDEQIEMVEAFEAIVRIIQKE